MVNVVVTGVARDTWHVARGVGYESFIQEVVRVWAAVIKKWEQCLSGESSKPIYSHCLLELSLQLIFSI